MALVKVCLLNTSLGTGLYPLSVGYLSAWLKKYGRHKYEVTLVDINRHANPSGEIGKLKPDVVGITCHSPTALYACRESIKVRKEAPGALIVCGGPHPTLIPEDMFNHGEMDISVIGEGERTFQELIDALADAGMDRSKVDFSKINGIMYRDGQELKRTEQRELMRDMDKIPHPDRTLFDSNTYNRDFYVLRGMNTDRVNSIITSRGCPHNCYFCGSNTIGNRKVRYHSPEYVLEELKELAEVYKPNWLFFSDDTFFVNKKRAKDICQRMIDAGLHKQLKWEVQIRSSEVQWEDLPILELMKKAGCQTLNFGFESGNQRVLQLLKGKYISIEDHERAIAVTRKAGLQVLGTFVIGVPSETREEMLDTERFIRRHLKDIYRFQSFILKPYPGTQFFKDCVEHGMLKADYFSNLERLTEEYGIEHAGNSFNYNVPHDEIVATKCRLDNLSLRTIRPKEYLSWAWHNLFQNPAKFKSGVKWVLGNIRVEREFMRAQKAASAEKK